MSKRKRNIIESVMHYNSIMLLLMVVLIGFGVFALINMPKNEFPSFTIRLPRRHLCRSGRAGNEAIGNIPLEF